MAIKPKRACSHIGCKELTHSRHCLAHEQHYRQNTDRERESAAKRGYDRQWAKARRVYLRRHPLCIQCEQENRLRAATVVDHIKPHKGDKVLFWDRNNWQPLCKRHHDIKTVTEDGGFGRG